MLRVDVETDKFHGNTYVLASNIDDQQKILMVGQIVAGLTGNGLRIPREIGCFHGKDRRN